MAFNIPQEDPKYGDLVLFMDEDGNEYLYYFLVENANVYWVSQWQVENGEREYSSIKLDKNIWFMGDVVTPRYTPKVGVS